MNYPATKTCNGPDCRKPIRFFTNANGNQQPVDADPIKRFVVRDDGTVDLVDTFTPHHQNCPNAKDFRRSRPGGDTEADRRVTR